MSERAKVKGERIAFTIDKSTFEQSKTPARLDRSILIVVHLRNYSITTISFCFAISLIFSIVNFETLAISESG